MLHPDLFTSRPTPGAPDKVRSWSVKYPYVDGDYALPRANPFKLPAWLGAGPFCNYAHGCRVGHRYGNGQPVRLTNPAFSDPPKY